MKIFAIGMNYTEHNKSLHGTLSKPERPVIFTKADSALLNNGKPFFIPDHLGRIEYIIRTISGMPQTKSSMLLMILFKLSIFINPPILFLILK